MKQVCVLEVDVKEYLKIWFTITIVSWYSNSAIISSLQDKCLIINHDICLTVFLGVFWILQSAGTIFFPFTDRGVNLANFDMNWDETIF